jgi:hypothetical protein
MTEDMRRSGDALLTDIDKRLALVEQAQRLNDRAADMRWTTIEKAIGSLTAEVRAFASVMQAESAEPEASPAGRAMSTSLNALASTVAAHDAFIQQTQGALRLARFAVGSSLIALVVSVLQIVSAFSKP